MTQRPSSSADPSRPLGVLAGGGSVLPLGGDGPAQQRTGIPPQDPSSETAARPVAIDLPRPEADAVRGWVEGVLGWQPVDESTAMLVPPTVRLIGPAATPPDDGVPRLLLLDASVSAAAAAAAAIRTDADAVVIWPDQRDDLRTVVGEVVGTSAGREQGPRILRVGGTAGGVGVTTVVLALAGLCGWDGVPSLAAIRGHAPVPGLPLVPAAATAAVDLWRRVPAPPGSQRLRAVRVADTSTIATPTDPSIALAVLDHGVNIDVDVVVCRPDAAALERLASTTAAAVVVMGEGPVALRDLAPVISGRRGIHLPWSARVARAGLHRRVPGGLPGSWLDRLRPLTPKLGRGNRVDEAGLRHPNLR